MKLACSKNRCVSLYSGYNTTPSQAWAAFASTPAATPPSQSDVYIIGGSVSKGGTFDMKETFPTSTIPRQSFGTYGLPADLFYTYGPLQKRNPPTYSNFGYCRIDQQ